MATNVSKALHTAVTSSRTFMTADGRAAHRLLPRVERHEAPPVALAALSFACIAPGALIARGR